MDFALHHPLDIDQSSPWTIPKLFYLTATVSFSKRKNTIGWLTMRPLANSICRLMDNPSSGRYATTKKIERMKIIYSTLTLFFFAQVEYYDILQNTVGGGKPKMRFHFYNTTQQFPTVRGQPTPPVTIEDQQALIDDLQDFKTQYYTQLIQESAECRPGVLELMDAALAHPQLVVGVCSASTKAAAQQTLHCTLGPERLQQLDVLLLGDDVEYKKPHPAIYQQAAEILKLEPSDCIVIEDSLVGLKAAVAAGMRCCITYTSSTAAADFRDATWVVPNLVEGGMITLQTLFGDDDIDDSSET